VAPILDGLFYSGWLTAECAHDAGSCEETDVVGMGVTGVLGLGVGVGVAVGVSVGVGPDVVSDAVCDVVEVPISGATTTAGTMMPLQSTTFLPLQS
jgi:hypothetical protein